MNIKTYKPHELRFSFCYRVYFRWRTHKGVPYSVLKELNRSTLDTLTRPYNIRILRIATSDTDVLCIVSLRPNETIAGCASKLKGRVSKWLSATLRSEKPANLLSKGYFACTIGKSRTQTIESYLDKQAEHHGYDRRTRPPVFVEKYELTEVDEKRLSPKHSVVVAQFHLVLSTFRRRGVLGAEDGKRIAAEWRRLQDGRRVALVKVSFVPDHVHIALRAHPAISPAEIAAWLMNSAQEIMLHEMIKEGLNGLWEASAYVGSYGDLSSGQISKYIENWKGE